VVKLNAGQLALLEGTYPEQTFLDAALSYARQGFLVFPLIPGKKEPLIKGPGGHNQATTDEDQIRLWWKQYPNANIGARMVGRLAVDLDFNKKARRLSSLPDTRTHHSGRGNGNVHLIYRVEPGSLAEQVKNTSNTFGEGIDTRTGQGYIVMPPSIHPDTGKPYTLDRVHVNEHTLTDEELLAIYEEAGIDFKTAKGRGAAKGLTVVKGSSQRPMVDANFTLTGLLNNPPQEGGRNDWLTKVAGFYAKEFRFEDAYELHVRKANASLAEPLDDAEVDKTLASIWNSEHQNHPERELNPANGYLSGNKRALFCQTSHKEGEETVYDTSPYADFDVEAKGVAVDDSSRRVYWVRLYWNGQVIDTTLAGATLGNEQVLKSWLADRGMSVDQPPNAWPKTPATTRLLRYLNSQEPPKVSIVTTLGWDEVSGGFVTHEGLITPEGPTGKEEAGVVANPALVERDVAPYVYGFARDAKEAQRVLREVLTFQYEDTASVFGAWWAAALLKPQIQKRTSLFPIFGVEAASESGKTNGFFQMMVALNGNYQGQVVPTKPVLRDLASANKSGIVWADDLNDLQPYEEILRASTSNGTASKMEADRSGIKNTAIVAPILVSGEALGFGSQKALVDRSVVLEVQSPKGRKSRHNEDRPQWDDIVALKAQYPDHEHGLSALAGHFVQAAMRDEARLLEALKTETRKASGRNADKLAVLRAGARLLDSLVGHEDPWGEGGEHYRRVVEWCGFREDVLEQDNTLTRDVLPWALRYWDQPDGPDLADDKGMLNGIRTPAFIKGDLEANVTLDGAVGVEIWYSPTYLAEAWAKYRNGRVEPRTESKTALQQQAQALGGETRAHRLRNTATVAKYRLLPAEYVSVVLDRVQG
jgi:hypothetical protein